MDQARRQQVIDALFDPVEAQRILEDGQPVPEDLREQLKAAAFAASYVVIDYVPPCRIRAPRNAEDIPRDDPVDPEYLV